MDESNDDFEYDSIASSPEAYAAVLDSAENTPSANQELRRGTANIITPSTAHRDTPGTSAQQAYGSEGPEFSQFTSSQQSQFGLQSGMYNDSESPTDFAEKLKGDVVVSGKWSAVGSQQPDKARGYELDDRYSSGARREDAGMRAAHEDHTDDTFDLQTFNESKDSTVQHTLAETPSAMPAPIREMEERRPNAHGVRSAQRDDQAIQHNAHDPSSGNASSRATPRGVSFAPMHDSRGSSNGDGSEDSIVFRDQRSRLSLTRPPWDDSLDSRDEADEDAAGSRSQSRQRSVSPMIHLPLSPAKLNVESTAGVGGVGMAGSLFRKFAGWTQNLPISPKPAAAHTPVNDEHDKDLDVSDDSDADEKSGSSDSSLEESPRTPAPSKQPRQLSNLNATVSSTSSASPMGTEPMHSNVMSNYATTPASARDARTARTPMRATTPRRTPRSARRLSYTPSRSVNPLARHLAIKAMSSVPSDARGSTRNASRADAQDSQDSTPTNRGISGVSRMLYQSPVESDLTEDASISESSMLSIVDIQRQLDGFARMLKHDASAVEADVLESERAWQRMEQELANLQRQLHRSESERELLYEQVRRAELDRVEWDVERQNFANDKADLLSSIENWRRRIGDVESDRQGAWRDGEQSREQLLYAIGQLEDELNQARRVARDSQARMATMNAERSQQMAVWEADRHSVRELEAELEDLDVFCDKLEAENRLLQADIHEARLSASEAREHAQVLEAESRALREQSERMRTQLAEYDRELKDSRLRQSELAAETLRIREAGEGMRKQIQEQEERLKDLGPRESKLMDEIAHLRDTSKVLKETLEDLTEQNRELKAENAEKSKLKPEPDSSPAAPVPVQQALDALSAENSEEIKMLKEQHDRELSAAASDRALLVEQLDSLVEEKKAFKDRIAALSKQVASFDELARTKEEYKSRVNELLNIGEEYQKEVLSLREELEQLKESNHTLQQQQQQQQEEAEEGECIRGELEQLRERESQLVAELDHAERGRERLAERLQLLEDRNRELALRNDELSQRTARLETELGDIQWQKTAANDAEESAAGTMADGQKSSEQLAHLQSALADLKAEISDKDDAIDGLRQKIASNDTLLEDLQTELQIAKENLDAERDSHKSAQQAMVELLSSRAAAAASGPILSASTPNSPMAGKSDLAREDADEAELGDVLLKATAGVSKLKGDIEEMKVRNERLEKIQRYLADQLRDKLLGNAALRTELANIILHNDGRLRELSELKKRLNEQPDDFAAQSDDGNTSTMSGMIDMVPSTSQLIDSSESKYLRSLDKHLDAMENIIDSEREDAGSIDTNPRVRQMKSSSPLRRSNSLQSTASIGSRVPRKVLTPIKEEFGAHNLLATRDSAIQCSLQDAVLAKAKQQIDGELEEAQAQVYRLEDELRSLRQTVTNTRQERDQFRKSQEEAAERVSYLTGQVEELSESHERMKAMNFTSARVALRVNRQLDVLKSALVRLGLRGDASQPTSAQPAGEESLLSPQEAAEDQLALEEDDAMMRATIDRPLDADDYALFGLPTAKAAAAEAEEGGGKSAQDSDGGEDGNLEPTINNEEVLEQVGIAIYDAYAEVKRLRRDIMRAKRERARLMKRLGEVEHSKLPSYALSSQWGRSVRHRSYTESLVRNKQRAGVDDLLADTATTGAAAAAASWGNSDDEGGAQGSIGASDHEDLIENMEPPASLFLSEESVIIKDAKSPNDGGVGVDADPATVKLWDGTRINISMLNSRTAVLKEISRLIFKLKKKDGQVRKLEKECSKLEKLNNQTLQQVDRLFSKNVQLQQQNTSLKMSADARSTRLTMTPVRGTNWDDIDSIEREMEQCKKQNTAFMEDVEKLCQVLNQHTIDQALACDINGDATGNVADSVPGVEGSDQSARGQLQGTSNMYRTLLIDMAELLDARGDLDERMSIRENFGNMASAIRRRLDDKDRELKVALACLEKAEMADRSQGNSRKEPRHEDEIEGELDDARARVSDLESQLFESQQKLESLESELDVLDSRLLSCQNELDQKEYECTDLQDELLRIKQENAASSDMTPDSRASGADSQHARSDVVQKTYDSQLQILGWARDFWSSVVRSLADTSIKAIGMNPSIQDKDILLQARDLLQAINYINDEVNLALKRVDTERKSFDREAIEDSMHNSSRRANISDTLASILRDLNSSYVSGLRDNVCKGVTTMVFALSRGSKDGSLAHGRSANGDAANISPTSNGSGSSRSTKGDPELTAEQKRLIRHHYGKKCEEKIAAVKSKFEEEISRTKDEYSRKLSQLKRRYDALVYESEYRRECLMIETNLANSLRFQRNVLRKLIGGYEGISLIIDSKFSLDRSGGGSSAEGDRYNSRPRRLWRRVLWAVRLKNSLFGLLAMVQRASELKRKGEMTIMQANEDYQPRDDRDYAQQQQWQQRQQQKPLLLQHAAQYNGIKTTPITPSRLRYRASDLRSSIGSSNEL